MARIVQRVVNHKYLPIKPDTLQEGTVIPFDCFIKRYDGFVIIIEAGTMIHKALHEKILQNQSIYVLKHDSLKVKEYYAQHRERVEPEKTLPSSIDLSVLNDNLAGSVFYDERLKIVYSTVSGLMQTVFEGRQETLPLDALRMCVDYMVGCVLAENKSVPTVLKVMPEEYTLYHHSTNVAIFSAMLGKTMGLSKEALCDLVYAALLHDVGKIRIEENILLKPGYLDEAEYRIMCRHPLDGSEILKKNGMESTAILQGVLYHHEKLDGSGYPEGLQGKIIPKYAKIIGLCDAFDALTTKRTFRPNYTSFEALMLIKRDMNKQFDESYTDAFIRLLR